MPPSPYRHPRAGCQRRRLPSTWGRAANSRRPMRDLARCPGVVGRSCPGARHRMATGRDGSFAETAAAPRVPRRTVPAVAETPSLDRGPGPDPGRDPIGSNPESGPDTRSVGLRLPESDRADPVVFAGDVILEGRHGHRHCRGSRRATRRYRIAPCSPRRPPRCRPRSRTCSGEAGARRATSCT